MQTQTTTTEGNKEIVEEFTQVINEGCEKFTEILETKCSEDIREAASDALIDVNLLKIKFEKYLLENGYGNEDELMDFVTRINETYISAQDKVRKLLDSLDPNLALKFNL